MARHVDQLFFGNERAWLQRQRDDQMLERQISEMALGSLLAENRTLN
ncbi:hypothetical protein [Rhizobium hidalgonense]|nr:hypothetical protein [Rhizobium hidalgonense]